MTVSGYALTVLWPHARDAYAILAAQDDPAVLSEIQVNSALRNSQKVVADNIEAALAAHDSGLADSFVDDDLIAQQLVHVIFGQAARL